jgi:hypothetical protein
MNKIYILHHQGLGDYISCNGILRFLLESGKYKKIILFTIEKHYQNVEFMYRDEKRIELYKFKNLSELNKTIEKLKLDKESLVKIGFEKFKETISTKFDNKEYTTDMVFYAQLDIPYENRFLKTKWTRDFIEEKKLIKELDIQNKPYIFIHDDETRDLIISKKDTNINNRVKVIKNDTKKLIFYYGTLLENAQEIHVMESSFRHIIESLDTKKTKLYLHSFRGNLSSGPFISKTKDNVVGSNKIWEIIKKNENKKNLSIKKIYLIIKKIFIKKFFNKS